MGGRPPRRQLSRGVTTDDERALLSPHQRLPPIRLVGRTPNTIRCYLDTTPETPFLQGMLRTLNMLLYFTMIGELDLFSELAGEVAEAASREGVDLAKMLGGDARLERFRQLVDVPEAEDPLYTHETLLPRSDVSRT